MPTTASRRLGLTRPVVRPGAGYVQRRPHRVGWRTPQAGDPPARVARAEPRQAL